MQPSFETHANTCVEVMRGLESESVNVVLADPPYCSGGITESQRRASRPQGIDSKRTSRPGFTWFESDSMTTNGFLCLMHLVAFEAFRLLRPGGHLLVFCDWRMYPMAAGALESAGLRLQGMLVWDKGNPGLGTGFKPQHELIAHLVKGTGVYQTKTGRNVLSVPRVKPRDRVHPTEKPVALLSELLKVVAKPGDTVLDPFAGSGSTGEAAIRHGCNFIGIDREAHFTQAASVRAYAAAQQRTTNDEPRTNNDQP